MQLSFSKLLIQNGKCVVCEVVTVKLFSTNASLQCHVWTMCLSVHCWYGAHFEKCWITYVNAEHWATSQLQYCIALCQAQAHKNQKHCSQGWRRLYCNICRCRMQIADEVRTAQALSERRYLYSTKTLMKNFHLDYYRLLCRWLLSHAQFVGRL